MTIPNSVTSIGGAAFAHCSSLGSVTISTNVTGIGYSVFSGCSSLSSVTIPNSVIAIGHYVFSDCSSLTTVTIGKSVTAINGNAFASCHSLSKVYFQGDAPTTDSSAFSDDPGTATVYYLPCTSGWGATLGGLRTLDLNWILFTANQNYGLVALTVNFTSPATDNCGNTISRWQWTFGDGSTSTAQNPSHTYASAGTFFPALIATNSFGNIAVGVGPRSITARSAPVPSGLVLNGSFETGDFTGWSLSEPDIGIDFVDDGSSSGVSSHSGGYFAALGSYGALSYLSQPLATMAGEPYTLSVWLDSPHGAIPNEFLVSWNGSTLFDGLNIPAVGWTNLQFSVVASGSSTVLQFGFRNDYGFLGLDDISVWPAAVSVSSIELSGTNLLLNGINGVSGGTYCVLMTTNLTLPLSQWTPVSTNVLSARGAFTITVTNTVSRSIPRRFYILQR